MRHDALTYASLLFDRVRKAMDQTGSPETLSMLDSLIRLDFSFHREGWYRLEDCLFDSKVAVPGEMLLRVRCADGSPMALSEAMFQEIANAGYSPLFDTAVILAAVNQSLVQGQMPISINVSARAAENAQFWSLINGLLEDHFGDCFDPADIVFELTEDFSAPEVNAAALQGMQAYGYRFALDDVSHLPEDIERQKNLGPCMDFVKIDGRSYEAAMRGEISFGLFLAEVKTHAPRADIITEWVESPLHASLLRQHFGVSYVTGRSLDPDHDVFGKQVRDVWAITTPGTLKPS